MTDDKIDGDMLGFFISVAGMIACVVAASLWECWR